MPAAAPPAVRRALAVHGVLSLLFAAGYAYVGFGLARGRGAGFNIALGIVCGLLAVSGVLLLLRLRFARPVALLTSLLLLGFAATVVALLVASAAYLRGIYGPLGQGMSIVTFLLAALVVQFCGLLPIFQLRMLLREDVKKWFYATYHPSAEHQNRDIAAPKTESADTILDQQHPKPESADTISLPDLPLSPISPSKEALRDTTVERTSRGDISRRFLGVGDRGEGEIGEVGNLEAKPSADTILDQQHPKLESADTILDQQPPKPESADTILDQQYPKPESADTILDQQHPKPESADTILDQQHPKPDNNDNGPKGGSGPAGGSGGA